MRVVSVLGATGSIGDSTMDLLRAAPERYQVEALTANSNVAALVKLAKEFNARFAAIADPDLLKDLQDGLSGTGTECGAGESAIIEAAARPADWVMAAVSGAAGLKPALAAVDRGATVALANKECLVCAGDFFMQRAVSTGACILPAELRAQRALSGPWFRQSRGTGSRHHHGLRRPVPNLGQRRYRTGDVGASAETSELEHGPEDHDQFRVDDEQGA